MTSFPKNILRTFSRNKLENIRSFIRSFYTTVPKIIIIGYTVPEIWHGTDVFFI